MLNEISKSFYQSNPNGTLTDMMVADTTFRRVSLDPHPPIPNFKKHFHGKGNSRNQTAIYNLTNFYTMVLTAMPAGKECKIFSGFSL